MQKDSRISVVQIIRLRRSEIPVLTESTKGALQPLPANQDVGSGKPVEPIERAHLRLIHHLGVGPDAKPNVADVACKDRSRLMRLAGTVNGKSGQHARILEADFQLAPYPLAALVGDLPDPPLQRQGRRSASTIDHDDPYKQVRQPGRHG